MGSDGVFVLLGFNVFLDSEMAEKCLKLNSFKSGDFYLKLHRITRFLIKINCFYLKMIHLEIRAEKEKWLETKVSYVYTELHFQSLKSSQFLSSDNLPVSKQFHV